MITVLSVLSVVCILMACMQIVDQKRYEAKRTARMEKHKDVSCIPLDADERVKAFLDTDKSSDKEFKLAVLVVEDEYGHKFIEDYDLRGDSADPIALSSFAIKRRFKRTADKFLTSFNIIDAISSKVNCVAMDTERYYAFQLTKENIMSGRHGKTKRKIAQDFVVLLDLSKTDLTRIANLSY